ncbi:hypothetical protein Poly30_41080 [Planctomycetes bacterium Poly30]|uniref:Peptidase C39-like domain-containing protein n=1 Tax=Saltatorellus ferox TaxID=2528018 RepID=A0A518EWU8_9BACT|nr:hypothetical protein Poly30_41080 [Planctomycetes bacterium Poly30]
MKHRLEIDIQNQPDLTTCGPTCLHAVYRYHGDEQSLEEVISRAPRFAEGGTLAVLLALDALHRGYTATIHTFNLAVFDPTWFLDGTTDLVTKLEEQARRKADNQKLAMATRAYVDFLKAGGKITWGDLTAKLLRKHLRAGHPLLTGLSSTYLYQEARERLDDGEPDDVLGVPAGHFVVLSGYNQKTKTVTIADPLGDNPIGDDHHYSVPMTRVICAILLGVLTYDANFLIIYPQSEDSSGSPSPAPPT